MSGSPSSNAPATPNLSQLFEQAARALQAGLHTWMPGQITGYDKDTQRATVQPMLARGTTGEDGGRVVEQLPAVTSVPVMFIGNGDNCITWPINIGDMVKLDFCEASLDTFLSTGGGLVDPGDDRRHSISDAVAAQGLRATALPPNSTDDEAMVMRYAKLKMGDSTANDPPVRVSDLNSIIQQIATAITGATVAIGAGGLSDLGTAIAALEATGSPDVSMK